MKLKRIPVDIIAVAAYNPRQDLGVDDPSYLALQQSIARWGVVEPLVWNQRTGNLVGGHQRLKVLVANGETTVDVSVVDLAEPDEAALNLALNRITGAWDEQKLSNLLSGLALSDVDLLGTGFNVDDLQQLSASIGDQLFVPAVDLSPLDAAPVTASHIEKAKAKEKARGTKTTSQAKINEMTCPHCGATFGVSL